MSTEQAGGNTCPECRAPYDLDGVLICENCFQQVLATYEKDKEDG